MLNKRLGLALSLLAISASLIVATRYIIGQPSQQSTKLRMKVLRARDQIKNKPSSQEIASLKATHERKLNSIEVLGPSLVKNNEEREIEDEIPKHLPLKVKLKKEKEEKVKDFKNDQWVRDFELEVTNTSEKPIYYLSMYVLLPEFVNQNGGVKGMPLRYGRMDFVKLETRPLPDDISIKPGETYTFKMLDQDLEAWANRQAAGLARNPRKLRFIFSGLSFGDGTGFRGTTGVPYPRNKQISQAELDARCLEQRAQKQEWSGDVLSGPPELLIRQPLFETRPAAFLPVRFLESTSVPAGPLQSGLCCPGTQCSFLKENTYLCVWCGCIR